MPTSFPTSLDNFTNPTSSDNLNTAGVLHDEQHANKNDAVEALEAKVGADNSAVATSHDYRISHGIHPKDTALQGDISPSQITANQNDYNPSGLADATVLRLSTDASRDITGLAGGADGRVIVVLNVGSNDLVLKDESASSSAANRFALNGDITLAADHGATLVYDSTSSRWRCAGVYRAAVATITVQEADSTVDAAVTTLDFGAGFDVTSSPAGEANVDLDLSEYLGIGSVRLVRKTGDETISASTTLQDDDHLAISVAANAIYLVEVFALVEAANVTMDIKVGWTVPASATLRWGAIGGAVGTDYPSFGVNQTARTAQAILTESDSFASGSGAATTFGLGLAGILATAGSSGTLTFRWAQNTSDAGNLTFKTNSILRLTRVA